jgi:large subunit ribosomal protein L31e
MSEITREYTIHMHKHIFGWFVSRYFFYTNLSLVFPLLIILDRLTLLSILNSTFKKRAPKAIKVIREFAAKTMRTKDVRLDPSLNSAVWARGVKSVPHRIRVRIQRKKNDNEDAKESAYAYVTFVPVSNFKGLQTVNIEEESQE